MPDEPPEGESDPRADQEHDPGPDAGRQLDHEAVDLSENLEGDSEDGDEVDPEVEAALEEGLKRGTIRETDDPLDPPEDPEFADDSADTGSDTGSDTSTDSAEDGDADADPEVPNIPGEELDFEGLSESDEEEEWTWGREKPTQTFEYKGMRVIMSEPEDDDEILNLLRERSLDPETDEEQTELDRLKSYAKLAIDSPEITDERWENAMTPTERLTIGSMAANYLEGEDFTTAPEGGQPPQPE